VKLLTRLVSAICLLLLAAADVVAQVSPQGPASRSRDCPATIPVDLRSRTVAGIYLDTSIAAVIQRVGPRRVRGVEEYPEGHRSQSYVIDFCGHGLRRRRNGLAFEDSAFRTLEGVGVSRPVAAFDSAYGSPEIAWGEGYFLRYSPPGAKTSLFATVEETCYLWKEGRAVGVKPTCPVREMSFSLVRSP